MLLVGLTGGICSGKSEVLKMFGELGAPTFDADRAAREALAPGSPALKELVREFGTGIVDPHGRLIRRKLRELAFFDAEKRNILNQIVHPEVDRIIKGWLEDLDAAGRAEIAVVEVPLLFELGLENRYHRVVTVWVDRKTQVARLMARDQISPEEANDTLVLQMDLDLKARKAHLVIDNTREPSHTREQVVRAMRVLRAWAKELGLAAH